MPERQAADSLEPKGEHSAEWQLPAALATRHAFKTAVESLVPAEEDGQDYRLPGRGAVHVTRSEYEDIGTVWDLAFYPTFYWRGGSAPSGGALTVGTDRLPSHQEKPDGHNYLIQSAPGDEEVIVKKYEWPGKIANEASREASQGELNYWLRELPKLEEVDNS